MSKVIRQELFALISSNLIEILKNKTQGSKKGIDKTIKKYAKKFSKKLIKKIKKTNKFIQHSNSEELALAAKSLLPGKLSGAN